MVGVERVTHAEGVRRDAEPHPERRAAGEAMVADATANSPTNPMTCNSITTTVIADSGRRSDRRKPPRTATDGVERGMQVASVG